MHEQTEQTPPSLTMAHVQQALCSVRPSVHADSLQQQQGGSNKRATLA